MSSALTAVIITGNEERNIKRCIDSLLPVVDEVAKVLQTPSIVSGIAFVQSAPDCANKKTGCTKNSNANAPIRFIGLGMK